LGLARFDERGHQVVVERKSPLAVVALEFFDAYVLARAAACSGRPTTRFVRTSERECDEGLAGIFAAQGRPAWPAF